MFPPSKHRVRTTNREPTTRVVRGIITIHIFLYIYYIYKTNRTYCMSLSQSPEKRTHNNIIIIKNYSIIYNAVKKMKMYTLHIAFSIK